MADIREDVEFNVEFNDDDLDRVGEAAERVEEQLRRAADEMSESMEEVSRNAEALRDAIDQANASARGLNDTVGGTDTQFGDPADIERIAASISDLSSDVTALGDEYSNIFSTRDFSGLREANNNLVNLRERANELRNAIAAASAQGIDTAGLEESLAGVEERLTAVGENASKNIHDELTGMFKRAFDKASDIAGNAFKSIFKGATKLVASWGKFLGNTFKTVTSGWKKTLTAIFTSRNDSYVGGLVKQLIGVASIATLIRIGKEAVELSSDLIEVQNVIDTVFKNATDEINDFAVNAVDKFGVTELEAKNMIGVFGGMLKASKITGEAHKEMSKNMTALAGDIASFYNVDVDEAFSKLKSGLAGQTQPLRAFGIDLSKANLEAYALARGITKSYDAMSQAEKTVLRYNYILEQTADAHGDYSKTFYTWSNQVRSLSSNFKMLLSILGGAAIKALMPTLTILNELVTVSINAANALASIFGFRRVDLEEMFGGGGGTIDFPEVEDYSDDLEGVADATDDVAEATKNANDNLQTFDKLNNISPDTGTAKAGVGGLELAIPDGSDLLNFDSYYETIDDAEVKISDKVQRLVDTIKKFVNDLGTINFTKFKKSWTDLKKSFKPLMEDLGGAILWFWDNVMFPFFRWAVQQGVPAIFDLLGATFEALHEIIIAVSPEFDRFWRNTLSPYFKAKGNAFVSMIKRWTKAIKTWTDGLRNAENKLEYLQDTARVVGDSIARYLGEDIMLRLSSIWGSIKSIVSKLFDDDVREQANTILHMFLNLNLIVFDNILKLVDALVGNTDVTDFVDFLVSEFGDLTDYTFDAIIEMIEYIAGSQTARDIITNIKDAIKNIIDWIVGHKEEILAFLDGASDVILWLSEHLDAVLIVLGSLVAVHAFVTIGSEVSTLIKLLTGGGGLSSAFTRLAGSGTGSVGAVTTAVLGSLIPALEAAAVAAGAIYIGKEAFDYWNTASVNVEEYNNSLKYSSEFTEEFKQGNKKAFDTTDMFNYEMQLMSVNNAFNEMDENIQSFIAAGKYRSFTDIFTVSEMTEDVREYIDVLQKAGYVDTTQLEKINALLNNPPDVSNKKMVEEWRESVAGAVRAVQSEINAETTAILSLSQDDLDAVERTWKNSAESAVDAYTEELTPGINEANKTALSDDSWENKVDMEQFTTKGKEAGEKYITAIADTIENDTSVTRAADTSLMTLSSTVQSTAKSEGKSIGSYVVSGIVSGLNDGSSSVTASVRNLAKAIVNSYKEELEIHSPSRVFERLSGYIPEGAADGISDNIDVVIFSITDMIDAMTDAMSGVSVDMSDIVDVTKFSDKYRDILYSTEDFTSEFNSAFKNMDAVDIQANLVTAPKVKQSELTANVAQNSQTGKMMELMMAMFSRYSQNDGKPLSVNVNVGDTSLAQFIIDVMTGRVTQTGGF